MPVIPTFTSQAQAQPVAQPRFPTELAGALGQQQAQAGAAAVQALDRLGQMAAASARAENEAQQNIARGHALRAMAEAEAEANGDVDGFEKRSREAFAKIAEEHIGRQSGRAEFLSAMQAEMGSVTFRVAQTRTRNAASAVRGTTREYLDALQGQAAAAEGPSREAMIQRGLDRIQAGVAAGAFSGDQAETARRQFLAQVSEGTARRLMVERPGEAVGMLRDPRQLPGLTPVRRYQLLDQAVRAQRRGGGGLSMGPGADPAEVEGLPREQHSALRAEGERLAMEEDAREVEAAAGAERQAFSAARDMARQATDAAIAGRQPEAVLAMADLVQPEVGEAVAAIAFDGGAERDDPETLRSLLVDTGDGEPDEIEASAARAVAAGLIRPETFGALTATARELASDTPQGRAWRAVRREAAEGVAPPDMGDIPGMPDIGQAQREALAEIDAWRAANPDAPTGAAREEALAIMARHREAMVSGMIEALPRVPALAGVSAPYGAEALDDAEIGILDAIDAGEMDAAEAGRQLRLIEAWRWVSEDGERLPDEAAGRGAGRGMRIR